MRLLCQGIAAPQDLRFLAALMRRFEVKDGGPAHE